jgi:hypothetical protein
MEREGLGGAGRRLWRAVTDFSRRYYPAALAGALVGIAGVGYGLSAFPTGRAQIFERLGWQAPAEVPRGQDNAVRRLNTAYSEKKDEAEQLTASLADTRRLLEESDREKMRALQDLERIQPSLDELPRLKADLAQRQEDMRAIQASLDDTNRLLKGSESDRSRLQLSLAEANRLLTISEDERRRLAALAEKARANR